MLNFDGSRVQNRGVLRWVFRDSNGTIEIAARRHLADASIIIAECIALRDDVLVAKNNGFLGLENEGESYHRLL